MLAPLCGRAGRLEDSIARFLAQLSGAVDRWGFESVALWLSHGAVYLIYCRILCLVSRVRTRAIGDQPGPMLTGVQRQILSSESS